MMTYYRKNETGMKVLIKEATDKLHFLNKSVTIINQTSSLWKEDITTTKPHLNSKGPLEAPKEKGKRKKKTR